MMSDLSSIRFGVWNLLWTGVGYEVAALIADGLLCRRVSCLSTGLTSQQALSEAIAAVELHTREQLRVDITLEIEHTCGGD